MCIVSQAADGSLINDIVIKTKKPKGKTRQKTHTLVPAHVCVSASINSQSTHSQLTVHSQSTHSQLTVNSWKNRISCTFMRPKGLLEALEGLL